MSGYGDGFGIECSFHPSWTRRKELYRNILVSDNVGAEVLDQTCHRVNHLYPYSVFGNNCQNFSMRVLRQLVTEGVITMAQFDGVWDACYPSISARWRSIINQPDLRIMQ
jgi:hypothetical protein